MDSVQPSLLNREIWLNKRSWTQQNAKKKRRSRQKQIQTGSTTLPLQMCISIHVSSEWLPWCDFDIVRGVCLSQDLPRGGWTSAASKVLSHEIAGTIKPSLSPVLFSTSLLFMWLSPCFSLSFTSFLFLFLYTLLSYTSHSLLFSPWRSFKACLTSPHPHPLASIGHKERIKHLFSES